MSGPSFTGRAIFAGVGQGVEKAVDNVLKLKQMQMMDSYHKYRLARGGVDDFWARGGHQKPIEYGVPEEANPAGNLGAPGEDGSLKPGMDFDPVAVEAANPTFKVGPTAAPAAPAVPAFKVGAPAAPTFNTTGAMALGK
jgi:hypothetical protein